MDSPNWNASTKPRQYIGQEASRVAKSHDHKPAHPEDVVCAYHRLLLGLRTTPSANIRGLHPMQRFMIESPLEQPAVFIRPDVGTLSVSRACNCSTSMTESILQCFEYDILGFSVPYPISDNSKKDRIRKEVDGEEGDTKVRCVSRKKGC